MSLDEWMSWQEYVNQIQGVMIGITLLIAVLKKGE